MMNAVSEKAPILAGWAEDPVRLSVRDECLRARAAWELVAPPDGRLPADATPLQCMLYARMTTSIFIYEVAKQRSRAKVAVLP